MNGTCPYGCICDVELKFTESDEEEFTKTVDSCFFFDGSIRDSNIVNFITEFNTLTEDGENSPSFSLTLDK